MGEANKLLAPLDGVPMLAHVVEQAVASKAKPILVVTGHQDNEIRAALAGRPVTFIHNPDFAEGLATSIKAGIAAVPPTADGPVVCPVHPPQVAAKPPDHLTSPSHPLHRRPQPLPPRQAPQ